MAFDPGDIITLLELPNELFIPEVFRIILGREPDIIGLMHYSQRLQRGLPRVVIISELCDSPEGQAHAENMPSAELEKLLARFRTVRKLPLHGLRWRFLPRYKARIPYDPAFNWEHWANDYVSHLHTSTAQQVVEDVYATRVRQSTASAAESIAQIDQLQYKLDVLVAALNSATSALQAKGIPEHHLQALRAAANDIRSTLPDPTTVTWEARQTLHQFFQLLRG